jgi:hypothetical protein
MKQEIEEIKQTVLLHYMTLRLARHGICSSCFAFQYLFACYKNSQMLRKADILHSHSP